LRWNVLIIRQTEKQEVTAYWTKYPVGGCFNAPSPPVSAGLLFRHDLSRPLASAVRII